MAATSQNKEKFEDYEGFVEKFKPKLTTDDCYTPPIVYDAVADWAAQNYGLNKKCFCRPFYPGGDYKNFDYNDKIVVDNPPFSILIQIVKFYIVNNIKFFLFAPTLSGLVRYSDSCTSLAVGADITYENGAEITTSFITNLEPENIRMRTSPSLYKAVHKANTKNRQEQKKQFPKYAYPMNVVSSAMLCPYNKYDIEFVIPRDESARIKALDSQRKSKKGIYGDGLLISDRLMAERKKAEREKAEREKAEQWELSEREKEIIKSLSAIKNEVQRMPITKEYITLNIEDIIPYENNPRINDDAVAGVVESIKQCGELDPIEVDENNVILSGHTRLKAYNQLGYDSISVLRITGLTEPQKRKYRLLTNKTGEVAAWDFDKLGLELEGLDFDDFDFGFDFSSDKEEYTFDEDVDDKSESEYGKKKEKYTICPQCGMHFVPILTEE